MNKTFLLMAQYNGMAIIPLERACAVQCGIRTIAAKHITEPYNAPADAALEH
ncbi:hypothetical protein [Pseudomonas tohonis]|uniref:hypothetical protein n=1 Tax=Pseudomonas tohonis TaxID=2725477 RepID=UPI001F472269|nr:hypothetical protein [Pseudomonas tohonis]